MANESSYAAYLSAGGRVARLLSDMMHVNLYDPTGLRFLMDYKEPAAMGSATLNITKIARGLVLSAASSEISGGGSNSIPTTTNYDLTYARYYAKMQPTDLFVMTSEGQALNLDYLFGILSEARDLTLTDLLVALFANVSGNVGTSGTNLSVDDIFSAMFYLNLQNNPAALACVLHPQQINDLIDSTRGETGAFQFRSDAQGILAPTGVSFRGQLLGVQFYQSDSVVTANAGADRRGCMFSAGAFAYTMGKVDPGMQINPADIIYGDTEMFIERARDADNAMSSYLVNAYPGTAEQEDLRAVRITTDA